MRLTERERKEIVFLLRREVQDMEEGWQMCGIGQCQLLKALADKIEKEQA